MEIMESRTDKFSFAEKDMLPNHRVFWLGNRGTTEVVADRLFHSVRKRVSFNVCESRLNVLVFVDEDGTITDFT